jgi:glucose-6-phosphate isomerase
MEMDELKNIIPAIRRVGDMEDVIFDRKWLETADPEMPLYYMYRGVERKEDLRYDITIIPSLMLGQECNKTLGHYHKELGEIYIVLEGEAVYLLQKKEGEKITDVYFIRAKKGEGMIIPPYYAHFSINPGPKDLKMANWNAEDCPFDYESVTKKQGACYYYLKTGWFKNEHYQDVPALREEKPLKEVPKNLDFLKKHGN